jgi:hypothetical protein
MQFIGINTSFWARRGLRGASPLNSCTRALYASISLRVHPRGQHRKCVASSESSRAVRPLPFVVPPLQGLACPSPTASVIALAALCVCPPTARDTRWLVTQGPPALIPHAVWASVWPVWALSGPSGPCLGHVWAVCASARDTFGTRWGQGGSGWVSAGQRGSGWVEVKVGQHQVSTGQRGSGCEVRVGQGGSGGYAIVARLAETPPRFSAQL